MRAAPSSCVRVFTAHGARSLRVCHLCPAPGPATLPGRRYFQRNPATPCWLPGLPPAVPPTHTSHLPCPPQATATQVTALGAVPDRASKRMTGHTHGQDNRLMADTCTDDTHNRGAQADGDVRHRHAGSEGSTAHSGMRDTSHPEQEHGTNTPRDHKHDDLRHERHHGSSSATVPSGGQRPTRIMPFGWPCGDHPQRRCWRPKL